MEQDVQKHVRQMLEGLSYIGPASNLLTQFIFLLPRRAKELYKQYPELMEREEELMKLFGLEFDSEGHLKTKYYEIADHIRCLYYNLFRLLSSPSSRKKLLELSGINEEDFKKMDPLRKWLESAMEYLANAKPDALKLLCKLHEMFATSNSESVYLDDIKKSFGEAWDALVKFGLVYPSSSSWLYRNEFPLLLDCYSDLLEKFKQKP